MLDVVERLLLSLSSLLLSLHAASEIRITIIDHVDWYKPYLDKANGTGRSIAATFLIWPLEHVSQWLRWYSASLWRGLIIIKWYCYPRTSTLKGTLSANQNLFQAWAIVRIWRAERERINMLPPLSGSSLIISSAYHTDRGCRKVWYIQMFLLQRPKFFESQSHDR